MDCRVCLLNNKCFIDWKDEIEYGRSFPALLIYNEESACRPEKDKCVRPYAVVIINDTRPRLPRLSLTVLYPLTPSFFFCFMLSSHLFLFVCINNDKCGDLFLFLPAKQTVQLCTFVPRRKRKQLVCHFWQHNNGIKVVSSLIFISVECNRRRREERRKKKPGRSCYLHHLRSLVVVQYEFFHRVLIDRLWHLLAQQQHSIGNANSAMSS